METFQNNWPFVRGIYQLPVDSPYEGQIWDVMVLIMTSL